MREVGRVNCDKASRNWRHDLVRVPYEGQDTGLPHGNQRTALVGVDLMA